jgi:hypothetical protein
VISGPPSSLPALRKLLAERFPAPTRAADDALPTGLPALDDATGGLPRPGLSELVCAAPSCGSQLFIGHLLQLTREQGLRVALIDGSSAFDPGSWPGHLLEHLVWVRAHQPDESLMAADVLARDANLGLLLLDLRQNKPRELRRIPSTRWYRLQRAIEPTSLAGLVLTPSPLVPSARLRFSLTHSHGLSDQQHSRPELVASLAPELLRQRVASLGGTA